MIADNKLEKGRNVSEMKRTHYERGDIKTPGKKIRNN